MLRIRQTLIKHHRKVLPGVIALALAAGLTGTIVATPNALTDYNVGCGYGYNSAGQNFGNGSGINFGYGYLKNGAFGYGYGNEVCPLAVTTTSLPGGTVGKHYSQTLAGTGGAGTYVWTGTGALPNGLTLSGAGVISGTPTRAGTFAFAVTMTDGNGQAKTASFSIRVAPQSKPKPRFHAIKVHGFAVVGRTRTLVITGVGFYGKPRITSNERGTRVAVVHDRGNALVIRVTVPFGSRVGWHTFTIRLANGETSRVNYLVK